MHGVLFVLEIRLINVQLVDPQLSWFKDRLSAQIIVEMENLVTLILISA